MNAPLTIGFMSLETNSTKNIASYASSVQSRESNATHEKRLMSSLCDRFSAIWNVLDMSDYSSWDIRIDGKATLVIPFMIRNDAILHIFQVIQGKEIKRQQKKNCVMLTRVIRFTIQCILILAGKARERNKIFDIITNETLELNFQFSEDYFQWPFFSEIVQNLAKYLIKYLRKFRDEIWEI